MDEPSKSPSDDRQRSIRPAYTDIEPEKDAQSDRGDTVSPGRRLLFVFLFMVVFAAGIVYSMGGIPAGLGLTPGTSTGQENAGGLAELMESQLSEASAAVNEPSLPYRALPELEPYMAKDAETLVEECRRVGKHLLEVTNNSTDAREMLARAEYEFGDIEKARELWQAILDEDSNYAYALRGLGDIANQEGELDAAVGYYRRAVLAQPQDLSRQFTLAGGLIAAGQLDEAKQVLDGMLAFNPTDPMTNLRLGQVFQQQSEFPSARDAFLVAIKAMPDNPEAHLGLAQSYVRLKEPESAKLHQQRYRELVEVDRSAASQESYDDNVALRSDIAKIYIDMAKVYLASNQIVAGEYILLRASRMDKASVDPLQALGWLALQRNETFQAVRWLKQVSELHPGELSYVAEIARIYTDAGQLPEAEAELLQFAQAHPKNSEARGLLSRFYTTALVNQEEAIRYAREAAESSNSISGYAWLAALLNQAGDTNGAIAAYQAAVDLGAKNPEILQALAILTEQQEGTEETQEVKDGQDEPEQ